MDRKAAKEVLHIGAGSPVLAGSSRAASTPTSLMTSCRRQGTR
jgi:hypothetical protein